MALKLDFSKALVKDNTNRTTKAESDILQQAEQIMARVTVETFNAMANTVASHEASISLQAEQIALRVASTDFNGETIASLINQTAAAIKIQAAHIELEGIVTANSNFRILEDGSIEAVNAKLSGSITATKMVAAGYTNYYGEIGVSGGAVGLGLFDLTFGAEAFFEVLETDAGQGFILRDRRNVERLHARLDRTSLRGPNGYEGLLLGTTNGYLQSPNGRTYIYVSDNEAGVVVNGVTKVRWN